MKTESNIPKESNFNTPQEYFDQFEDRLTSQIKLDQLLKSRKDSGFKVPEGYFEALSQKLEPINPLPKVIALRNKAFFWKMTGIAAAIILIIALVLNPKEELTVENVDLATIESYISENDIAFSTYDLTEFLPDESVEELEFTQDMSDAQMLDYLENNIDEYDLMIQ